MSLADKLKSFLAMTDADEETYYEEESREDVAPSFFSRNQSTTESSEIDNRESKNGEFNLAGEDKHSGRFKTRIRIMEPRLYSEVRDIADVILADESVVLNFRRMDKDQAKKVIDFLMGITYAVRGDIQRIGDDIFLWKTEGNEIEGSELQALKNSDLAD